MVGGFVMVAPFWLFVFDCWFECSIGLVWVVVVFWLDLWVVWVVFWSVVFWVVCCLVFVWYCVLFECKIVDILYII